MGMFDTFFIPNFKCPRCDKAIETIQTKQFDCILEEWSLGKRFNVYGKTRRPYRITVPISCYNCYWEDLLEITIKNNTITNYKGVGFKYYAKS